jgi:dihydrofolate reductase
MGKLSVFNNVTLDGYFCGVDGDLSWAYTRTRDPEWDAYVAGNASGGGALVFGRKTYQMMENYWPSPAAAEANPVVAGSINARPKYVFSRTLDQVTWNNTTLVKSGLADEIRKLKETADFKATILGSGSLVSQLTQAGLIDEYVFVVNPIVLGAGKTLFDGVERSANLNLIGARTFANGSVVLTYSVASDAV